MNEVPSFCKMTETNKEGLMSLLKSNRHHLFSPTVDGRGGSPSNDSVVDSVAGSVVAGSSTAGAGIVEKSDNLGEEDPGDETDIILDQDQTASAEFDANEDNLGGDGSDRPPLESSDVFEKGRRDVKDQLDRNIRAMNSSTGRNPNDSIMEDEIETAEDNDDQSYIVTTSAADFEDKAKDEFKNARRGHSTGAFTDIGEGRSSVTRTHGKPKPSDNRH
jgi:hypothetical protein